MSSVRRRGRTVALGAAGSLVLLACFAACTDNTPGRTASPGTGSDGRTLSVHATDSGCSISAATAPSGRLRFAVTNGGTQVTEFYLLGADGHQIVGELENIGPGLSRDLVVTAAPGAYVTACKPGMAGDGIRAPFTVSDSGADLTATGAGQELVEQSNGSYRPTSRTRPSSWS